MTDTPTTVPATATPDLAAIVAMVLRLILLVGGSLGVPFFAKMNAIVPEAAALIAALIGALWAMYEPWRVQQHIEGAATASALETLRAAAPRRMMYRHYGAVQKIASGEKL